MESNEDGVIIIKVGDRVNLNTEEGPDMVVSKIETESGIEQATCSWFEDQRPGGNEAPMWVLKEEVLPLQVLVLLED